jgi:predicted permease
MNIKDCQREMRTAFLGGFAGQMVSGFIWLVAAAASTWTNPRFGIATLFFGSMLIFPLTQGSLRLMGYRAKVHPGNELWQLGSQIAFMVPIYFLLVGAATLYRENWFFPAAMIVVGTHYLPFVTLYGMKIYAALAAILVCIGAGLAIYFPGSFSIGGWFTGITLMVFALIARQQVISEYRETI